MAATKVSMIGAGSQFTFRVVADLIREAGFAGSTVALVDTDEAALDLSSRVVKRMVGETGADLVCEAKPAQSPLTSLSGSCQVS